VSLTHDLDPMGLFFSQVFMTLRLLQAYALFFRF